MSVVSCPQGVNGYLLFIDSGSPTVLGLSEIKGTRDELLYPVLLIGLKWGTKERSVNRSGLRSG